MTGDAERFSRRNAAFPSGAGAACEPLVGRDLRVGVVIGDRAQATARRNAVVRARGRALVRSIRKLRSHYMDDRPADHLSRGGSKADDEGHGA